MTKSAAFVVLFLLVVSSLGLKTSFAASSIMAELETVLAQLEENPKDEALFKQTLELGAEALRSQGIAFHETTKNGIRVLQIDGGKATKLNRFAGSVDAKLMGLKIFFNPGEIAGKGGVLGFYNTNDHTFSFAYHLQDVITLSNTTIHHELLHAVMTPRINNDSNDTPYAFFIMKKKADKLDEFNPYSKLYPTQELATHALDLRHLSAQLVRLKDASPAARDEIMQKMMGKLVIVKLMAAETGDALVSALSGLKDGSAQFSNDPENIGGGRSKHFMIETDKYTVLFPMPSTLDNKGVPKETVRRMLGDLKFLAKYENLVQDLAKAFKSQDSAAIFKAASALNAWARTGLPAKLPAGVTPITGTSLKKSLTLPFFACESLLTG